MQDSKGKIQIILQKEETEEKDLEILKILKNMMFFCIIIFIKQLSYESLLSRTFLKSHSS